MKGSQEIFSNLHSNISKVIYGKDKQIRSLLCCWIAGGHVLLEDVPGTGKTILARALAKSADITFKRVQFTPDLLPSDVLGISIFNQSTREFEFKQGPIFTTLFLGDEINRATPRTQSALLECMSEKQVSIEGDTYKLNPLFFTLATQNPVDQLGTFALPEAQMDRFMMKISMGYPDSNQEVMMLKNQNQSHPIDVINAVETQERLMWLKAQVSQVHISDEMYEYIVSIGNKSRSHSDLRIGASPRATIALCKASQTRALYEGSNFVLPEHVQEFVPFILRHRLILKPEAKMSGRSIDDIIFEIIESIPVPTRFKTG